MVAAFTWRTGSASTTRNTTRMPARYGPTVLDVATFRAEAAAWLAANRSAAPRDYGAILPPDLADGRARVAAAAVRRRLGRHPLARASTAGAG